MGFIKGYSKDGNGLVANLGWTAISDARECDPKDKAKKIPIVKIIERWMLIEMAAVLL